LETGPDSIEKLRDRLDSVAQLALALQQRNTALEARIAEVAGRSAEAIKAVRLEVLDRVTALEREIIAPGRIRVIGEQQQYHLEKLLRLEGEIEAGAHITRGWWCDQWACGRTRGECVALAKRLVFLDSRHEYLDGKDCARRPKAWCARGDEALACKPAPCTGCTERD
jgi:hypothetical protein